MTYFLHPGIKSIDQAIAEKFQTTVEAMNDRTRNQPQTFARQFSMYFEHVELNVKQSMVARRWNYDHATVINACKVVLNARQTDKYFRAEMDKFIPALLRIAKLHEK